MPTLSDILAAIDALKRGIATNPLETAKDYGRGVVANAADMGDMALQAFSPTPRGMGPNLGEQARGLLGNTGTSVENTGGLLGIPGAGTAASAGMKLAAIGKGAIPAGGLLGQMVFHGTPHKFAKYDLSKIGTGEGAQAYGHGIYFAESPGVADSYQKALSGLLPSGWSDKYPESARGYIRGVVGDIASGSLTAEKAAKHVQNANANMRAYPADKLAAELAEGAGMTKGTLYQQDLPDSVLPRMLQWDKPLSEQPESVRKAPSIAKLIAEDAAYRERYPHSPIGERHGSNVITTIPEDKLRAEGILGLSYLDAGSRAGGKGTMNHVIWDQDLLDRMIPQAMP